MTDAVSKTTSEEHLRRLLAQPIAVKEHPCELAWSYLNHRRTDRYEELCRAGVDQKAAAAQTEREFDAAREPLLRAAARYWSKLPPAGDAKR